MEVGTLHVVQNYYDRHDDRDIMRDSLAIADLYEPAGFDFLLIAEHHLHGYAMSPVPFDFLSYMAGRTSRIKLGPGVIIVPWNDPYRAASHLIMLDYLSDGRAMLGLGRGLSKIEMDNFGIDMSETRAMFDEGARKIIEAVTTGIYPGGGRYYSQHRRFAMRPAPRSTDWSERTYCVGMTPPSAIEAGRIGGRLMAFANAPWEVFRYTHLEPYKAALMEYHGREAAPIVVGDSVVIHEDEERAREMAELYIGNYHKIVTDFYDVKGAHLKTAKGYEAYAQSAELLKGIPDDIARRGYVDLQLWGTPKQIIEKLRARRELLDHPIDLCATFGVGDMSREDTAAGIKLFGEKVLPVIQSWDRDRRGAKPASATAVA